MKVTFAVGQWLIGAPRHVDDFAARVERELAAVAAQGAQLALLPEYLALELAYTFGPEVHGDLHRSLAAVDTLYASWLALFGEIAQRHGIYVLAGSFLRRQDDGSYRNRSLLFDPQGRHVWQEKLRLTGFEKEAKVITPGNALKVFDTELGRVGINICYDVEFPLYARAQAEAGAVLLLVPSCTDTLAGAARVRIGCQARALENQIPVLCAVTAGESEWSAALDTNTGHAAIYVQPDRGLPDGGVLAELAAESGWLVTEMDVAGVQAARANGQVGVAGDWQGQLLPGVQRARVAGFESA
ncbi:carbon-nitrogen hydrolase family protein [Dyella nitratireducens]|uniref:Nitrilase n=1 Tax=Dyella nitratireducens TaxID=1849580 RepID=A0ABQ1FT51_9GAMM|nr:carbon-nitrogen hydrolase family protein [Dyella nitratireducens]GGA29928.1 nitrilase [Dyella nitratireducens]GLQ43073.1 nitrilase [Dyella nitratireducens]